MRLISSAFLPNEWIPTRYTCDRDDISPPLAWFDPPARVRSFALVCSDPDAPRGVWHHWAIYDISPDIRELGEHWPPTRPLPPQALNDFGHIGYGGPCPPIGSQPHHYHFTIYALEVEHLDIVARPHCRQVVAACSDALARAELIGIYGRP